MLTPVLVRASYKVSGAELIVLEDLLGSNLPLLFPEVQVMNRTETACTVTVSGLVRNVFTNQPDPDFNGAVTFSPFLDVSLADGQTATLTGLPGVLTATKHNITTEITLTNSGPAAEAWLTLLVRGMIESAVSPDAAVTINV